MDATIEVLRTDGIAGASARVIADKAGVDQALVFDHFETVTGLIDQACRAQVVQETASYREELEQVTTLRELLELGRRLHARERAAGNITVMAQVLAGAQRDEALAETSRYALGVWSAEVERAVERVLAAGRLDLGLDPVGLAKAVSASFIGLILYDGVDPASGQSAFGVLDRLGELGEVLDGLGPAGRAVVRSRLRQG